jgi:uncharacterized protein involved in exopolysaccharide biosynthesis
MPCRRFAIASIVLCATALPVSASFAATPAYVYSSTVQLASGKTLNCGVNEPLQGAGTSAAPLTRREQTEADVLATQRLRLLAGPTSPYPSPLTAPDVTCAAVD